MRKKVSNLEIKHSLDDALKRNDKALDDVENWIKKCEDLLLYNENDVQVKEELETLKYIKFCLLFLYKQCSKAYKKVGGKI